MSIVYPESWSILKLAHVDMQFLHHKHSVGFLAHHDGLAVFVVRAGHIDMVDVNVVGCLDGKIVGRDLSILALMAKGSAQTIRELCSLSVLDDLSNRQVQ